jgi:4-hydroxyphenylpyruvate dioxygenase-like putative hemolysin
MKNPLNINLNNLKLDQLGFVYKDIEKQAKIMEEVYGIPKFSVMELKDLDIKYRGKETKISQKIAMSRLFNVQIELIQQIKGDCIYQEFLDAGKEGLQHFSFFIDDLDFYINAFQKAGFEIIHYGQIGKQRFAYFDTEETFGFLLEFQETVKRKKKV